MNNELVKAFQNDKFGNVRVVLISNGMAEEPYFVGKDVAECLGYSNTRDALKKHVFDEDKDAVAVADSMGRMQNTTVINESGLYGLVFGSELKSAKEFKHWVTSEVLPSIRKHGAYITEDVLEVALNNPDMMIGLLTKLKEERQVNKALELQNAQQKQIICELQPKATYYDFILQSNHLMPISLIAKDYGMGAPTLNTMLHELGVQYKQGDTWLLYAKHQDKGYTSSKTTTYQKKNGTTGTKLHTQWTQKGRLFIYHLLKGNGVLPTIEREV